MKALFLDIDGVLNCQGSTSYFGVAPGIDEDKLQRIVQVTGAQIVLTSSWKEDWAEKNAAGRYLDNVLSHVGLSICDKTEDHIWDRGAGIQAWINSHKVQNYVIFDDERFDYRKYPELSKRLIQTVF